MSADGEVEVQVQAEGVDDTAEELSDEGGVAAGGGGGGGGGDRGGLASRLGSIGRILGVIAALLASLGPLLKFVEGVFNVLSAYLAPISLMLMRLLMPFLRMMIQFLPTWLSWMETASKHLEYLSLLFGFIGIIRFLIDKLPDDIWSMFRSWATGLTQAIVNLPENVGQAIASKVPGVSPAEGGGFGRDVAEAAASTGANAVIPGSGPIVNLALNGGLDAFVERIERDSNVDIP